MKRKMMSLLLVLSLLLFAVPTGAETTMTGEETAAVVQAMLAAIMENGENEALARKRITEETGTIPYEGDADEVLTVYTLKDGGRELRFLKEIIGEADENGIYVSVRGVSNTWDLHFQEETYPLLDALITNMTVTDHADPNRVYLLGFSAGGDGVYQLAPRLADRFAAVNISSGHPNDVSLVNMANCPICLQAGFRDYYSESAKRSIRCAEFEKTLNDYRENFGFGYEHQVWIHVPEGHNYVDYADTQSKVLADPTAFAERAEAENMLFTLLMAAETSDVSSLSYWSAGMDEAFDETITGVVRDTFGLELTEANTNAVRWVSQYVRNPAPAEVVWDLGTRAASREITSWYWLQAEPSVNKGIIYASFDSESNTYTVLPMW